MAYQTSKGPQRRTNPHSIGRLKDADLFVAVLPSR